jgi:Cysteine-rich secretory protein family
MCGRHCMIAFVILVACCAPALADTLNSFRQAHGLPALHRSAGLQALAQRHASSMAARGSMDHSGFYSERGPRGARAENVAWGCATESCAIRMWEASPATARTCCWLTLKVSVSLPPLAVKTVIGASSWADKLVVSAK